MADLTQPPRKIMSRRRRRYAEKARQSVEVEFHAQPIGFLDEWMSLFAPTVQRLNIRGIRGFSRASIARQLSLPGSFMSLARHQGEVVSAHIQLVHGDTAYEHLAAQSSAAYTLGADYALYHADIEYFADKVHWLDWGRGVGLAAGGGSQLALFKRGWSTGTRPVYFGGRIFSIRSDMSR